MDKLLRQKGSSASDDIRTFIRAELRPEVSEAIFPLIAARETLRTFREIASVIYSHRSKHPFVCVGVYVIRSAHLASMCYRAIILPEVESGTSQHIQY